MAGNRGFRWVGSIYGGAQCPIVQVAMKVSQTLYKGNALMLSATAGHGSVGIAAEGSTTLFGYSVGDSSSTATEKNTRIQVVPFIPGHIYEAIGAKSTMTSVGYRYRNQYADLEISTTGYSRIDTGASTKHFRILGIQDGNENGATGAGRRWFVTPTPSAASYSITTQG